MLIGASFVLSLLFGWRLTRAAEPFLPLTVLNNPVMRTGHGVGVAVDGRADRAHHRGADVFRGGVPPERDRIRHRAHPDRADHAGLAPVRPGHAVLEALQARAGDRACAARWSRSLFLIWRPDLPLAYVILLLAVVGTAVGLVYPVTTVSIQNAVPHHQVGIAMGALNFFRSLASAFIVAVLGAILLAGLGVAPERGGRAISVIETVSAAGIDVAFVFRWVFLAAFVFLALSLLFLILMEERPLRGSVIAGRSARRAAAGGIRLKCILPRGRLFRSNGERGVFGASRGNPAAHAIGRQFSLHCPSKSLYNFFLQQAAAETSTRWSDHLRSAGFAPSQM